MALSAGVITRNLVFDPGGYLVNGQSVGMTIELWTIRNSTAYAAMVWTQTGEPWLGQPGTFETASGSAKKIPLPITDQSGWQDGDGQPIDVSGSRNSHSYAGRVTYVDSDGRRVDVVTLEPFILPEGDGSDVEFTAVVPVTGPTGITLGVPYAWQSADSAEVSASAAAASAMAAQSSEVDAETAEANAASSASAAQGYANDAASSATSADISESNAAGSATDAATSASAAAASASAAQVAETHAETAETNAAGSASAAAASATSADTSEANAASSASVAQSSEQAAELAETHAETAEANAEQAATTAQTASSTITGLYTSPGDIVVADAQGEPSTLSAGDVGALLTVGQTGLAYAPPTHTTGTGQPSGVPAGGPGTTYYDTDETAGAKLWLYTSGGWQVTDGDTGWRIIASWTNGVQDTSNQFGTLNLNSYSLSGNGYLFARRTVEWTYVATSGASSGAISTLSNTITASIRLFDPEGWPAGFEEERLAKYHLGYGSLGPIAARYDSRVLFGNPAGGGYDPLGFATPDNADGMALNGAMGAIPARRGTWPSTGSLPGIPA